MQVTISATGTEAFQLPAGLWIYTLAGTVDTATVVALYGGDAADGSDHVAVTDKDGTAIQHTNSATPEPQVIRGGGYLSLVTTDYDSSSGLAGNFRKASHA